MCIQTITNISKTSPTVLHPPTLSVSMVIGEIDFRKPEKPIMLLLFVEQFCIHPFSPLSQNHQKHALLKGWLARIHFNHFLNDDYFNLILIP